MLYFQALSLPDLGWGPGKVSLDKEDAQVRLVAGFVVVGSGEVLLDFCILQLLAKG